MSGYGMNKDYTKAKVVWEIDGNRVELGFREARKYAIWLLKAADEMEEQRGHNLKRAQEAMRTGYVDAAAEIAQANGFTDDELNGG